MKIVEKLGSMLLKIANVFLNVATVMAVLVALGVWLLPHYYVFALLRSLTPQISLVTLFLLVLHLFRNKQLLFLGAYAALMLFIPTFLGLVFPDSLAEGQKEKAKITVAQFNVLKFNSNHKSVIESIKESEADIVSLQEIDRSWSVDIYKNISKIYPYSFSYPSENCCFGIALYSKIPLNNAQLQWLGGVPNITADIQWQGEKIHVLSAHTHAPITPYKFEQRNIHIADMALYLQRVKYAKMVIGDFNSVPWDNFLKDFKEKSKMTDSRHSYVSTFPSFLGKFGIPIDYIFHSKELECVVFTAIPSKASDHNGIKGIFQWKNNSVAKN